MLPDQGQIVRVRSRQYLVEMVRPGQQPGEDSLVGLSCLDDDAQGEPLEVLWEREVDGEIVGAAGWGKVAERGFDDPRVFSAYLHTLRWNTVSSTRRDLFQAPYRAGIDVMAYQLEPLRKALRLPRVNLFIADDVGLGKTIEAGLILRELLLRQKVRRVVVACPPSVVLQWRDELETRFGLTFVVFDRDYVLEKRRERGYGINAWATHSRFIISHALLRDESYAAPLRDWLQSDVEPGQPRGTLLILDEAHNAAPASGSRYAVDSRLTRVLRELAPLFEHRLFLSATPHNGHSNSFSALLEILDPQRFCRGVPAVGKHLEPLMVRRLKGDLREVGTNFPLRRIVQLDLDGLDPDDPDLLLPRLLDQYRAAREQRMQGASRRERNAVALMMTALQKRLLSSIEAFACTLRVHRQTVSRPPRPPRLRGEPSLLVDAPDADADQADLSDDALRAQEDAQVETVSELISHAAALSDQERALLDRMTQVADQARNLPDARVRRLVSWIREHCLAPDGSWNDRRVLLFTEFADTKRYLDQQLRDALADTPDIDDRIGTFHGGMDDEAREDIKRAFNAPPSRHPLRILVATDAAREGVNLQNHCADLFHVDVPWNPSRMEQRNGRIDRKLQRSPEVRCHYFFYAQRPEDRVLAVLVDKTQTIQRELGSLAQVLEGRLASLLDGGLRRDDLDRLRARIQAEDLPADRRSAVDLELDAPARKRRAQLEKQQDELRDLLDDARKALNFDPDLFRDALSCSLQLLGARPLTPTRVEEHGVAVDAWSLPADDDRLRKDPSWDATLDTLRAPRPRDQKLWDWRRSAPIRPVVFRDTGSLDDRLVHLHLEHRLAQRLLGRFLSQGFVHDDLSRATAVRSPDATPRVLLLGRLSLYGDRAARLHDEIVPIAARWTDPSIRKNALQPYAEATTDKTLDLVEKALLAGHPAPPQAQDKLRAALARDLAELLPHAEQLAQKLGDEAAQQLARRGDDEAAEMTQILDTQRQRIQQRLDELTAQQQQSQLALDFPEGELRQLEADQRHWRRRIQELHTEMQQEPARAQAAYAVRARRFDVVGVVYLWPETG